MRKIDESKNRELIHKDEGQEYAQVTAMLGDCRVSLICADGVARKGKIRGSIRQCRILIGDHVLIGKRTFGVFEDEKADVIHKYTAVEVRQLVASGDLPDSTKVGATALDLAIGDEAPTDIDIDFI